jgi:hypothetical protein
MEIGNVETGPGITSPSEGGLVMGLSSVGRPKQGAGFLEGAIDRHHGLRWHQLADLQNEKPERTEAPRRAQSW